MDRDELIEHIRGRVERCRRLAKYINDPRTTEALLQMASEGEADLRRLEAEQVADRPELQLPPQV